jgi:glutamine synthetase
MPDNLSITAEADQFAAQNPNIQMIDCLIPDMGGVIRGKRMPIADLAKLYKNGISMPGSLFALDVTGENTSGTGLVWRDGDSDRLCFPVPGTLCRVPWADRPIGQLIMTMTNNDTAPMPVEPRNVLKKVVKLLNDDGFFPVCALELEFFVVDQDWRETGRPLPPKAPRTGIRPTTTQVYSMDSLLSFETFINDIYAAAAEQGVPLGATIAEYAPGQFEINFNHVDDPLKAADHAMLFKRLVKGVADHHELEATFMAKLSGHLAGSGLHIHCSMNDKNGRNIFDNGTGEASKSLEHAVAGLCQTMDDALALFAPNANSYRRFQKGSYAPMSPSWGFNNRTVAFRVPLGAPRIEHRSSGADANPYLALAAVLAGMHLGLKNQMIPPPAMTGNAYDHIKDLPPPNWQHALYRLDRSTWAREYLGEWFVDTFLAIKHTEVDKFLSHVSNLDYDWYLRTV